MSCECTVSKANTAHIQDNSNAIQSSRRHLLSKRTRVELSPAQNTLTDTDDTTTKRQRLDEKVSPDLQIKSQESCTSNIVS